MALAGCDGLYPTSAEPVGYSVGPGSNEITVRYGTGAADERGVAELLLQDNDRVMVRVMYHRAGGAQLASLEIREMLVALDAGLGDRIVVNEAGDQVPKCVLDTFNCRDN